jgi:hypothetical protein
MRPAAWSYSSLADYKNCPKAFYEKRVVKSVQEVPTEQIIWGNKVHKAFELYCKDDIPLPDMLEKHRNVLNMLRTAGDVRHYEKKVALDLKLKPCGFFDKEVFFRGVIDYHNIQGCVVDVVDFKTGKQHGDFSQLKLFAIWIFAAYPEVWSVRVRYYWTPTGTFTGELYHRDGIAEMWADFTPDLRRYAKSFKQDIWPAKPSGLCNGWCPVTTCQHWKPKRKF